MLPVLPIAIGISALVAVTALSVFIKGLRYISQNQGYTKASEEFNKKFHKQYEQFITKEKNWEKDRQEYEDLIKAYEEYIDVLKRNSVDLKKNGVKAASSVAITKLGTTPAVYIQGLDKEISNLETCLTNLKMLEKW